MKGINNLVQDDEFDIAVKAVVGEVLNKNCEDDDIEEFLT